MQKSTAGQNAGLRVICCNCWKALHTLQRSAQGCLAANKVLRSINGVQIFIIVLLTHYSAALLPVTVMIFPFVYAFFKQTLFLSF